MGGGERETKHLHELEQPDTVQHNAKTPLTDIIITHPAWFYFSGSASDNTMVRERCSSETATLPHIVTGRAAGREATGETCQALSLSVF